MANTHRLRHLLGIIAIIAVFMFLLKTLVAEPVIVVQDSMAGTISSNSMIISDKITFKMRFPALGDIVIFKDKTEAGRILVKRVTAVEGQTINGQSLAAGEIWVEGDNQAQSIDSREFGPIKTSDVLGKGWAVIWPLTELKPL